jgi:hypothetical protein
VIVTVSKAVVAQASDAINFVENVACSGLEHIVTRIPVLEEDTTSLLQTTTNAAVCLFDREATYLATVSPIWSVMDVSEKCLLATGGLPTEVKSVEVHHEALTPSHQSLSPSPASTAHASRTS